MQLDITDLFNFLRPDCKAIYLGGSRVLNFINNPHDYDIICFIDSRTKDTSAALQKLALQFKLRDYKKAHSDINIVTQITDTSTNDNLYDLIQVRDIAKEEHSYGSYINKKMIKLLGKDIEFTFDIINKDRIEYINILKTTLPKLLKEKFPLNQKRWYQVYIGLSILENNSYELTDEQKLNANILHDMEESTLEKRLELQKEISERLEKLEI